MEVILLVSTILTGANKLLENEAVGGALKAVTGWIGNLLGSNSAKVKLQQIEQNQNIEANVNDIKVLLENALEDKQELQDQLRAKIDELQKVAKKEGIPMPVGKTNTMNFTGNENFGLQDINTQGNITISL
jgi:hypothetical protein